MKTKNLKGKRENESQEPDGSDTSTLGIHSDSDDSTPSMGSLSCKGPSSPGLQELSPARLDFRALVSTGYIGCEVYVRFTVGSPESNCKRCDLIMLHLVV
jgi:hypothetical protein